MISKSVLVLILFIFISHFCKSQINLSDVEMDLINDVKVKEYLQHQIEINNHTFSDIEPSLAPISDVSGYNINIRNYKVKNELETVWLHYINTAPKDSWNCSRINYSLLFSKNIKELFYSEELVGKLETGQVVFLNLKFLKGIYKLAVAFEITSIDNDNKIIEFSYIKGNLSEGKQQLKFIETKDGFTKIEHKSFFKSNSAIRDNCLYPFFHTRVTNNFHRNMKKKLKSSEKIPESLSEDI